MTTHIEQERKSTLPEMILDDLRWKPDQAVINRFGESVYLKQMKSSDGLPFGYVTDCCFTGTPCQRHRGQQ